ncbi:hypothetical protein D3C76_746830 [compost metagenome]
MEVEWRRTHPVMSASHSIRCVLRYLSIIVAAVVVKREEAYHGTVVSGRKVRLQRRFAQVYALQQHVFYPFPRSSISNQQHMNYGSLDVRNQIHCDPSTR